MRHAALLALATLAAAGWGCGPDDPGPEGDDDATPADDDATPPGDDDATPADDDATPPEAARWLFLVYMDGDNNLEVYVPHDLNELELAGSGAGVHVVVQADRIPGYEDGDGDWTGTRRYYITADDDSGTVSSEVVEDVGELDMGDPTTLSDFLLWAVDRYPAERVAVSLWDHGDGWGVTAPVSEFIASDDTSGSALSIAGGDLRAAFQPFVDLYGPLDVVAFDGCNMAGWEVAHSMRDQALAMVASEALVGGAGLQYAPAIRLLRNDPEADAATLADAMARDAVEIGGEWTYSATDLSGLDALAAAIDALAGEILADPSLDEDVLAARDEARGTYDDPWEQYYLDLRDFVRVLGERSPALAPAAQAVDDAAADAVLGSYAGVPFEFAGGLNIFFDHHAYYVEAYDEGDGATWAAATRWDEVVEHFFGAL